VTEEKLPYFDYGEQLEEFMCWPGQAEFLESDFRRIGLFTGAGNGKSRILTVRALKDGLAQDGWWLGELAKDWRGNPLRLVMSAPHSRHITNRLAPAFRGMLSALETHIGRKLHAPTGKNRNGWFDSKDERRQEMGNAVVYPFYGLHDEENAIAADVGGMYIDEGTFLDHVGIWTRANQRVRDPRAITAHVCVVGTPEKSHFLYEIFFDPETDLPRPDLLAVTDSALSNPLLGPEFFEDAASASEDMVQMQVFGKWTKGVGGHRFSKYFDEATHIVEMDMDPRKYPHLRWDLGLDPGWASGSLLMSRYSPRHKTRMIYDEIVIQGKNLEEVLYECRAKGYSASNIKTFGLDPHDATKHTSNSSETNEKIVRRIMGVKPRIHHINGTGHLGTRLDVIAKLLQQNKILINRALMPRNRHSRGIVNSLRNFEVKSVKGVDGKFVDEITAKTKAEWKHSIDALHYILMTNEHAAYRAAKLPTLSGRTVRKRDDWED
jgi:hypothetical protein